MVHASWLSQIEIYFSIVQRKVFSPNDFADLDTVINRLSARYNQTARPFKWNLTTDPTNLLPARPASTRAGRKPRPTPSRLTPDELRAQPLGLA